jgi:tricarballylate dehydrogenase
VTPVVVVGGGNAALCAAISARRAGADVLLLERAPRAERGGNSKYTRNLRCVSARNYSEAEFLEDLRSVSGGSMPDDELARLLIRQSESAPSWMESNGVRWQAALSGSLQLARTNRFFLGGGKALLNVYYDRALSLGVRVLYGAFVKDLQLSRSSVHLTLEYCGKTVPLVARAAVIASGGYEANLAWLETHIGPAAKRYAVRGTRFNDGLLIDRLYQSGAALRGKPGQAHAIAVDDRSPSYDAGIVSRIDSIPFGIVINDAGRRFADEGADIWPKRYASWGELVASQPNQLAFSLFESRYRGQFIPSLHPPLQAMTIADLAQDLGLDSRAVDETVAEFNRAAPDSALSDLRRVDGRATCGLLPPKSNWASPLLNPPFCAYPLRPGITFTYCGLTINTRAQVIGRDTFPLGRVYACGEAIAGNFLRTGYLAGIGMTIGTVFGRIAGEEAAAHARRDG